LLLLLANAGYQRPAAIVGTVFFVARTLYTIFYNTKDGAYNKLRILGSGLSGISILAAFILAILVAKNALGGSGKGVSFETF